MLETPANLQHTRAPQLIYVREPRPASKRILLRSVSTGPGKCVRNPEGYGKLPLPAGGIEELAILADLSRFLELGWSRLN
jgi:hypothetical protein